MGSLGLYEFGFRVAFRGLCYIRLLVAGVEKEYPFE